MRIRRNYTKLGTPLTFAGINKTSKLNKISRKKAYEGLSNIDTYTQHRHYRKPKYRNPFFAYIQNEYVQMDLIDLAFLSKSNNGVKFLLSAIDTFSRRGFIFPLKNKKAETVKDAIKQNLLHLEPKIRTFICDLGSEFKNKFLSRLLLSNSINIIFVKSEKKQHSAKVLIKPFKNIYLIL